MRLSRFAAVMTVVFAPMLMETSFSAPAHAFVGAMGVSHLAASSSLKMQGATARGDANKHVIRVKDKHWAWRDNRGRGRDARRYNRRHDRRHRGQRRYYSSDRGYYYRNDSAGAAAAAGVLGLAAGALIGSALSAPQYVGPQYVAPPPAAVRLRYAPWTPEWYAYCSRKYRSFNPQTGYFLAYSGKYRFCK